MSLSALYALRPGSYDNAAPDIRLRATLLAMAVYFRSAG